MLLFVLAFPISGAMSLKLLPQGEYPEQLLYEVLIARWFRNSITGW